MRLFGGLLLLAGVDAFRQLPARCLASLTGLGEGDGRVDAKGQLFFFASYPVFEAP
ncbi:hypothetical protein D9M73_272820 [compost metagenome]